MRLAAACNAAQPPATAPSVAAAAHFDPHFHVDMKQSVTYLASDELEGRMIGTPGIQRAADFIAAAFAKLGLQTVSGLDGYFQPFQMTTRVDPDPTKTALVFGDRKFALGEEFMPLRASANGPGEGQVVFAGYGITDPDKHYDDYSTIDAKGKIVLIMRYEPQTADGKSRFASAHEDWSNDATMQQKIQTAIDHGAVGVLMVNPALGHSDDEKLVPFSRRFPFGAKRPVFSITVEGADWLLRPLARGKLQDFQTRIDQGVKPDSAVIPGVAARMSFASKPTDKQVENVVGLLRGKGEHADEYVVVGAHYDHLGHGGPGSLAPWSHGIHHGADDNASGTSAVMDLADRFAHLGPQPRSIIFITFSGEEEGLLGSEYFVNHCPVPLSKIVAMLNLDMVGRVRDEKLLIGGEHTAAIFAQLVRDADSGMPLKLDEFGNGGGMGPSDHMSFALKKIPVLFLFSGLHLDYHRPTDTADKINYQGMEQVVDFAQHIVETMTTMPRQKYDASMDGKSLLQLAGPTSSPSGARASMGAIPDYSQGEDAKGGMRIGGIVPGSPAEKVGLRAGDLVVDFNGTKIDNMMDYTAALGKAKAGQAVKVRAVRDGKPLDVEATLAKRND